MGVETETERRGIRGRRRDGRVRVVVRCESSKPERRYEDDDSGREYDRVQFHMLEVNTERQHERVELHRDVLPSLLSRTASGVMLSLDGSSSSISVFGGLRHSMDRSLVASFKPPPERRNLYYQGAATINLRGDREWKPFPLPRDRYNAGIAACAVLGGKLYSFGWISFDPEVFDPSLGYWRPLQVPSHVSVAISGCKKPCYPVVADPSNNRILIHFRSDPFASLRLTASSTRLREFSCLYAFYPAESESESESDNLDHSGRWELLRPQPGPDDVNCGYFPWAPMVAVSDDLLFLYEFGSFLVYDLAAADPGEDRPLDVVWSSSVCSDFMVTSCLDFDALFSLGNGLMCFARYINLPPPDSTTTVELFVFKPIRIPGDSTSVILTPISFHSKTIEATHRVHDFLPLSQEASEILVGKLT